ncbi:MAG: hypothetical protein WCQ91_01885, partial [Planctomycetota bacterium]
MAALLLSGSRPTTLAAKSLPAESTAMATVSKSTVVQRTASQSGLSRGDLASGLGDALAVGSWNSGGATESKSDRYLAKRLAAASADYKGVALTTFLLGVSVGLAVWLAFGIFIEHWLVIGGLPRPVRWAWLGIGLIAFAASVVRWVVPLLRYRVNLVYAARAIEQEHPDLHNDLVNTVLVKAHPEGSAAIVVRSMERRAARSLSSLPTEAVIDRTTALRLAYMLAVLVGLACIYEVAAPKSLLISAARLLAPWVGWAAPSRVRIESPQLFWRMPSEDANANARNDDDRQRHRLVVESGVATLVRGRQLVVASEIRGLQRDERVIISVTPLAAAGEAGGAAAPTATWQVEMLQGVSAAITPKAFTAMVPDLTRGLETSVEIVIAAGDARSERVRIAVVDSPSLLVREVRYDYPPYTGRQSEAVAWQGDMRAIEGTQVTIVGESNQPLEAAWIDFDCDEKRDLKFKLSASDLARASVSFALHMNADRTASEHASYRLVFQPRGIVSAGREQVITELMEHRIEVVADMPPEVSIEEPRESVVRVPPGAPVTVRVRAMDPDFALSRVGIETRLQGGATQPAIVLFESTQDGKEKHGPFRISAQIVPEKLGATAGGVLEYRAVAVDTRPKHPNVSFTPWQSLTIDALAPPRQPETPSPQSDGRGQSGDEAKGSQGNDDKPGSQPRDEQDEPNGESSGELNPDRNQDPNDEGSGQQNN